MKLIPPPPPTVPIGTVASGGRVVLDPNWALYLTVGLLNRIGGYNAPSVEELSAELDALELRVAALEDAVGGWTELEVDFGSAPVSSATFVIVNANITATSLVRVMPLAKAAEGRTADDWAWDTAVFAAEPAAGTATVYATFLPGPIVGPRKVQYTVG